MNKDNAVTGHEQKTGIDWNEVHRRIEKTQELLEQGFVPSPEETRAILKNRAKTLALEPAQAGLNQNFMEIVKFHLSQETYGIETAFVREVYPLKDLTPLPCTPSFVLGIINIHGQILSVIDLKKFFDLPERGIANLNKVIVVRKDAMEFGILADEIIGISSVPVDNIQPSLAAMTGIHVEYLRGVTGDRLIVLDMERFLTDRKITVQEEIEIGIHV
jgi:purine-binding chemotaxis protein CheW